MLQQPIAPPANEPIIEIPLRRVGSVGLTDLTICAGYLTVWIVLACEDGSKFGLKIEYSKEDSPLGTPGSLGQIDDLTDPFIVMNGDPLTTLRFDRMLAFHTRQEADITVAVHQRDVRIDFGVVEIDGEATFAGKVRCYREECYWLDIGRMDDYALAQKHFAENESMFLDGPS